MRPIVAILLTMKIPVHAYEISYVRTYEHKYMPVRVFVCVCCVLLPLEFVTVC